MNNRKFYIVLIYPINNNIVSSCNNTLKALLLLHSSFYNPKYLINFNPKANTCRLLVYKYCLYLIKSAGLVNTFRLSFINVYINVIAFNIKVITYKFPWHKNGQKLFTYIRKANTTNKHSLELNATFMKTSIYFNVSYQ